MNETIVASSSLTSKAMVKILLGIAAEAGNLEDQAVDAGEADTAHLLESVRTHAQACASKAIIAYTSGIDPELEWGIALDKLDAHARAARLLLANPGAALAGRLGLLCGSVRGVMADLHLIPVDA